MRRYLITLLITIVAITGIGSYYVFGALEHLPRYKIETTRGSANEFGLIKLSGMYTTGAGSQSIELTLNSITHKSERSFYENYLSPRDWFYKDWEVAPLVDAYRGFMRGKINKSSFYLDEEWLIYAEPVRDTDRSSGGMISVAVEAMHRSTGEVRAFNTALDSSSRDGRWPYLADVQLIGQELHLLLGITHKTYQFKDYIVNFTDGAFLRAVSPPTPAFAFGEEGENRNISYVSRASDMAPDDIAVLSVTDYSSSNKGMMMRQEQFLVYRYSTGEWLTIVGEGPSDLTYRSLNAHQRGSFVTVNKQAEEQLTLTNHAILTDQTVTDEYVYTPDQLGGQRIVSSLVWEDRAYVLVVANHTPVITVIDLNNGGIAAQGIVVFDGPEAEAGMRMEQLDLYNLSLDLRGR